MELPWGDLGRLLGAQEGPYADKVGPERLPKAIKKRRLKQSNLEGLLESQKFGKTWIAEAKIESSWMNIGTKIDLMLKTAHGLKIMRFPIECNDFDVWGIALRSQN